MTVAVKRAFLLSVVDQAGLIIRLVFFDHHGGGPYCRAANDRSGSRGVAAMCVLITNELVLGFTLVWMLARQYRLMGSVA
jgi:hypothetical protein